MFNFSIRELIMIALLLEEEDQNNIKNNGTRVDVDHLQNDIEKIFTRTDVRSSQNKMKRKRIRKGSRPLPRNENLKGEYWTLYEELVDDEDKFFNYFRMNRLQFEILLKEIEPLITKQNTPFKEALSPKEKLAVCLRYLTTGNSFASIGRSYKLGYSTVSIIIKDVCSAIIEKMKNKTMPTPTTEQWLKISEEFWNVYKFPNCIGVIDGKLIVISVPGKNESEFKRKKTSTIVLMPIVDADHKFIYVDISIYNINYDGCYFSTTNIGKAFQSNALNIPGNKNLAGTEISVPHVIVGNKSFPLKTYLMRPYSERQIDEKIAKFNYRLSLAQKIVESAFRMLTQKFHIYHNSMHMKTENAVRVILTTCILHNYIKSESTQQSSLDGQFSSCALKSLPKQRGNFPTAAFGVREDFAMYFNSP